MLPNTVVRSSAMGRINNINRLTSSINEIFVYMQGLAEDDIHDCCEVIGAFLGLSNTRSSAFPHTIASLNDQ